jgi:hypothetical protein
LWRPRGLYPPELRGTAHSGSSRPPPQSHTLSLAGGSYEDISAIALMTVPSIFRYVNSGMSASPACELLALRFPKTRDEMKSQCDAFAVKSTDGALRGCVGAVDGWLCRIKTPTKREAAHITSYFSGHYHCYGINVQASCDHLSRFKSFSMKCPGGANDVRAFQLSSLHNTCANFPLGVYLVGDNANIPTEGMLTPFTAADRMNERKGKILLISSLVSCV